MTGAGPAQRPRRRWVWLLVAAATTAAFVVPFAVVGIVPKVNGFHQSDPPTSYRRHITGLQVQADGGADVTIQAGKPGQVTVSSALSWTHQAPTVRQTWQGGSLLVSVACPKLSLFERCQASVVIAVPAGTPVRAQAGAGTVIAAGLAGPLQLSATSGLLMAMGVSGRVSAAVTSGSVIAQAGLTSDWLSATAATGQLTLAFTARPRHLAIGVGAGSARITLPRGSRYHIMTSGGPGQVSVAPGLSDARSSGVIAVRVGDGQATIAYPAGAG